MADVFAEIDEMMRQERMEKIWKDYGALIITFVVVTILGTAGFSGYKAWNNSVAEAQTEQLVALQRAADYPQNMLEADVSDMRGSLRGIALLSAADDFLTAEKNEEALTLYERVAGDKAVPTGFRQLADLMIVRLGIDAEGVESSSLLTRLESIIYDSRSPWAMHARLEAAVIEAHLNKNYEAARAQLAVIKATKDLPRSLSDKASALDHLYGLKMGEGDADAKE